jgi:hypothetical protein
MAQRRYENGWTLDFPEGLNWREERQRLTVIAAQRGLKERRKVRLGELLYEAMKEYNDRHEKKAKK